MSMKMSDSMLESLTCPICLEIAKDAVESTCCHHIFCEECKRMLDGHPCPQCRKNDFTTTISHVTRRIIGNLPVPCEWIGCKDQLVRSELKEHMAKCQHRIIKCPSQGCVFSGKESDFVAHLAADHKANLVKNAEKIFQQQQDVNMQQQPIERDLLAIKRNGYGRICRPGETGKYYCGGSLGHVRCPCCNGYCGPTNGCNCSDCMKMDVKMHKLPPKWYINREGAISRISPETGRFYCGRCVLQGARNCDGYCGPTNGPNCQACRILQVQEKDRYKHVWSP
eukprot:gene13956-15412_t